MCIRDRLKREAYRDQTTNEYLPDEQVFTVAQELEYVREGVSTDYRDLMMSNGDVYKRQGFFLICILFILIMD